MIASKVQQFVDWALLSVQNFAIATLGCLAFYLLAAYFTHPKLLKYPGPIAAKFTDLWLARQAMRGNRYQVVHDLHQKHGKMVRIAPNHVSIADHKALNAVYGHSTGTLKSDFYDAFAAPGFPRGLFNTRSRPEHTRKRKIVSHTFAPKSVTQFEPFVRREVQTLVEKFEERCKQSKEQSKEWHQLDMLLWMNYFAFDTIGSLAFGTVFGMLEQGRDDAEVAFEQPDGTLKKETCNAVQIINERGEYSATMGCIPVSLRWYFAKLPWFSKRLASVRKLSGIALSQVNQRLTRGSEREDLLQLLATAKDDQGQSMPKAELTAEALTQVIAGSDTLSNTSTAIVYHLCTHKQFKQKLQEELDAHLEKSAEVALHADVQDLPYLSAVINESLRYHSTSSLGLPRLVPPGGAVVSGRFFPGGTVLSVPAYTIHRSKSVWGEDAEEYNPERWLEEGAKSQFDEAFVPFSVGPRACVGRNVAMMELKVLIATMFHKFDFELVHPDKELQTAEGFLRKPVTLPTLVKMRS